ncbi:MAG TPA: DUF4397 domain-containing protein, partial [Chitinophagaceae bacterium]|nr:DUF4397 domain-containing protein [Chitinophagaceae bacterium]
VPEKTVAITIGGNILPGSPLAFNSYTGTYLPIFPGTRTIESFDYSTSSSLATTTDSFAVDKFYSVFVVGTTGAYQNVIVNDNFDSLSSSGQSYIRYINAIHGSGSPTVTISTGGNNVVNTAAPFASVSDFTAVTPGEVTIAVNNGSTINVNRTITTEAKKVYTVLLSSGATSSDPAQIKFIVNGTLDDASGQRVSSSSRVAQTK